MHCQLVSQGGTHSNVFLGRHNNKTVQLSDKLMKSKLPVLHIVISLGLRLLDPHCLAGHMHVLASQAVRV